MLLLILLIHHHPRSAPTAPWSPPCVLVLVLVSVQRLPPPHQQGGDKACKTKTESWRPPPKKKVRWPTEAPLQLGKPRDENLCVGGVFFCFFLVLVGNGLGGKVLVVMTDFRFRARVMDFRCVIFGRAGVCKPYLIKDCIF